MIYGLPMSLTVNGIEHPIRTDFRDIMTVIYALNDPDLEDKEKAFVLLYIIYEDFEEMNADDYKEALNAASDFINHGAGSKKQNKKLIDFEQDENLIISAVNRVAGCEVREKPYVHWWTFMGYFMEIGECTYSHVLNIRSKKSKGKSLEKWEQEFYSSNKDMCDIKERLSKEEKDEIERIKQLLD